MKKECKHPPLEEKIGHRRFISRLVACVMLLAFSSPSLFAQERQTFTVDFKANTLGEVFDYFSRHSDYVFTFNSENIRQDATRVTHSFVNATLESILTTCLEGTDFTFEIVDRHVVIKKRPVVQQGSITVRGFVYDEKKQPLPGVTVRVVGTSVGTATAQNGWFSIGLPILAGQLEFSFVGYKKQQVNFTSKTDTLHIVMEEDTQGLDEVQVIAYGERKKRDVVSAISSVSAEEIKEIPSATFTSLLQGRMAGVEIVNVSGSPGGGGTQVHVRGYNSLMVSGASDGQPLYVIDGVPMHSFTSPVTGTNALAELDPNSIESIEVLKDAASAALYGSRAGNGVILITTKRGKVGQAQFQANVSYTASIMPEYPEQLGGREERRYHFLTEQNRREAKYDFFAGTSYYPVDYNDAYHNGGVYDGWWGDGKKSSAQEIPILQDSLNSFYNNQSNWWKQFFRTGQVWNANIQASGGSERIRYMVGMGYYTEKGINYGSDFKRATFVANLSMKPARMIRFDTRINLGYTDKSRNTKDNSFQNASSIEKMTADPRSASSLLPVGGVVEDEFLKKLNGTVSRDDSYRLMMNAVLGIDIWKGLSFSASLGLDFSQNNSNVFEPSYLDARGNNKSTGLIARNISITQENLLRYSRVFNEVHNLELLVGMSYTEMQEHSMQGYGTRLSSDDIYYVDETAPGLYNYGTTENPQYEALQKYMSNYTQQIMMSYLGRVAYNYKSKYLMEFTYRRDGSSAFGEDCRWADFPSIAVGWSFSEEPFLENLSWLSFGKIRASWGTSGQILNDPYLAHGIIQNGEVFMGNQGTTAPIINRDLSWEESDQYDIGLDVDVLDYRLKFKMDYYYKFTKKLLYDVELPGNMYPQGTMWQNAMEVSNEGLELELIADIFRESAVSWRMKFNISRNWNRFKKSYSGTDINSLVIGRPLNGIYLYAENGYVQNQDEVPQYSQADGSKQYLQTSEYGQYYVPGMRKYVDLNGDGRISTDDKYYAFSAFPKAHGGWTHELQWKGITLNLHFSYVLNRKMINQFNKGSLYDAVDQPLFIDYRELTFWEKEGDQTDMPKLGFSDDMTSSIHVESVYSLRLNTLNLGYDLPKKYAAKVGMDAVRFFFTGENLFLLTNYSGLDPEIVSYNNAFDNMTSYPLARKFTLGLTLNF